MIEIVRVAECPEKDKNIPVKVVEMGNVVEVQYMSHRNHKATIQMLKGGKQYIHLGTGEIKNCDEHSSRADLKKNLYRTFKTLRALINSNVTDVSHIRWITLTYAENMTDTQRLYTDFKKFHMRFKTYCSKKGFDVPEYIVTMEPQGRGAWHCHLLYIFPSKAPFISNEDLANVWGHGFVTCKKIDDVDNVGAYLTAYLGDMDVEQCLDDNIPCEGFEVKAVDIEGKKKYFVKGARLSLYPAKFNLYRTSRGIKKPIETMLSQFDASKKVLGATKTFEKTVLLSDKDSGFNSFINTVYYNKTRGIRPVNEME